MADNASGQFGVGSLLAAGLGGIAIGQFFSSDAQNEPRVEYAALADFERQAPSNSFSPESAPIVVTPPVGSYDPPTSYQSTYYSNCSEARYARAAPVRYGDPGYASHLDRDNDGVGCE